MSAHRVLILRTNNLFINIENLLFIFTQALEQQSCNLLFGLHLIFCTCICIILILPNVSIFNLCSTFSRRRLCSGAAGDHNDEGLQTYEHRGLLRQLSKVEYLIHPFLKLICYSYICHIIYNFPKQIIDLSCRWPSLVNLAHAFNSPQLHLDLPIDCG